MKLFYQPKPAAEDGFLVCDSDGEVIQTHRDTPYVPLSKQTASCLCRDLNEIAAEFQKSGEEGPLPNGKLRESFGYCLLSTIIEYVNGGSFGREPADVAEMVQWDMVFRLSPQPLRLQNQLAAIEPLKKSLNATWVDLPLNYSSSLEEMEEHETGFVTQEIIEELEAIYAGFSWTDHTLMDILFNFSGRTSITTALFWVAGIIDSSAYRELHHVFYYSEGFLPGSKVSRNATRYIIPRLNNLAEIRLLIEKHDPKLIEKLYVE
jgi:hypothetical protein